MRRSLAFLLPWIISWVLLSLQNQQGVVQAQNTSVAMPRKGKRARHLQNTGQGRRPASSDGGASGGAAPMQSEVDDDAGTSASALVVVVPSESDDDDDASNTSDGRGQGFSDEYSDGYSDEDTDKDFQDESPSPKNAMIVEEHARVATRQSAQTGHEGGTGHEAGIANPLRRTRTRT